MNRLNRLALFLFPVLMLFGSSGCERKASPPLQPTIWQALPLGTAANFRGIWFADPEHGWIVGGRHDIAGGFVGRTRDGGLTWTYTSGAVFAPSARVGCELVAVHFFDAERGAAAGCGAFISTQDGGNSWDQAFSPPSRLLWTMQFIDSQHGWAYGEGDSFVSVDAGQVWRKRESSDGNITGQAIQFLDPNIGWLAGKNGKLMRTGDGGQSWTAVALPFAGEGRRDLLAIHFVDAQRGWVVGEEGTILSTRDGGATWSLQDTRIADARSASRLDKIQTASGMQSVDTGDRTPGLTLAAVRFVDASRGWVVGHYRHHARSLILHTLDGGASWTVEADITGEEIQALHVLDADHLWAVGARTREGMQSIYRRAPSPVPVGRN